VSGIDVERKKPPAHGRSTPDQGLNPSATPLFRHAHIAGDRRTLMVAADGFIDSAGRHSNACAVRVGS